MKASRYNILIDSDEGTTLLFNTASAAMAEIEPEHLDRVKEILASPDSPRLPQAEEFFTILCEGKFLIPKEMDEFASLVVRNRRQRFGGRTLFLTIAPTLACNFRCDYCFEHPQSSRMSPETEHELLKFAERKGTKADKLLITWFGGEPTLCMETVAHLQSELRRMAQRLGLDMLPTSMVTNGYHLDRTLAIRLRELGITDVQVTLDGPRRIHDARRKLAGGGGTFDRIVANLREAATILQITIRVNVDRNNVESAVELAQELKSLGVLPKANLYFAPVNDNPQACSELCDRCLSTEDFSATQTRLYEKLALCDISQIEYPMLAPGGHCGADAENAFVVAPSGDLFKCWEEISMERADSIGAVYDNELDSRQERNLNSYLSWDPLQLAECRDCRVLPICMGGCPRQGMKLKPQSSGACCSWKYNLEDMLRLRHHSDRREEVTK